MLLADADILRASFLQASASGDVFVENFYRNLFALVPAAATLFPGDMTQQRYKLLISLTTIFEGLDDPRSIYPYMEQLGQKHLEYGVEAEHYPLMGQALIQTLREALGEGWTPELEVAWLDGYKFIEERMRPRTQKAA